MMMMMMMMMMMIIIIIIIIVILVWLGLFSDDAMDWTSEESWFDSRRKKGFFLLQTSIEAMGPFQPPVQWAPWALL
jgi:amino acid transporter